MDDEAGERLSGLFASHYDEVLAYCARRVGRNEAEDAAADVFAVATRRVDEIDWTTVRPWLFGVARRVLANRWRSIRRRQRLLGKVALLARVPSDGADQVVIRDLEARPRPAFLVTLGRGPAPPCGGMPRPHLPLPSMP